MPQIECESIDTVELLNAIMGDCGFVPIRPLPPVDMHMSGVRSAKFRPLAGIPTAQLYPIGASIAFRLEGHFIFKINRGDIVFIRSNDAPH